METAKWTDVVQALSACGSLWVTLLGFVFVIRQLRQVDKNIRADANANLCQQSIEILNAMMSRSECYPFFYDGKPLALDDPYRMEILCIAEMIANYLDLVALQKDNLPIKIWNKWQKFTIDTIQNSPVITEHLTRYSGWYSDDLNQIVKQAKSSKLEDNS
jgi:hypothetical protein